MIVCSCHGIPCSRIRSIIREGAQTVDAVGAAYGAGTDCGSCRDLIDELIEESASSESRSRSRLPMLMTG